jgi:hypothetical protein
MMIYMIRQAANQFFSRSHRYEVEQEAITKYVVINGHKRYFFQEA